MKKIITLSVMVLGIFFSWHGFSQTNDMEAINRAKLKYSKSLKYNDFGMAKNAIYDLIVLEPNNYAYLDSLAYMYYEFRQYASAALVSKDALKYNANNQLLLQIAAQSFNELGAVEQSMQMYQRLYNVSDDAFILYEVANKQYELKKYQDALINTELLLGKPMVSSTKVKVNNSDEEEIEVLFKAVVFNLQGLIAKAQGNDEDAKKYFNNALKIAPNYALPQENLNPSN